MPYLAWKSFDWRSDALPIFDAIRNKDNVFFLDSSRRGGYSGRYSFLGFEPFYILKSKQEPGAFSRVRELLERFKLNNIKQGFPFSGGAVGYFSYDSGLCLEKIRKAAIDDLELPDLFLGFYDCVIAIDHWKKKLAIFSSGFPEKSYLLAKKRAESRLKRFIGQLSGVKAVPSYREYALTRGRVKLSSNFTRKKYLQAVAIAKDYIKKGDIYQVNLSQRFFSRYNKSAFNLYKRLRHVSPSEFSGYLDCGDFQILSSSPERFLYFDGRKVSTRPMKGTRPRGISPQGDLRQKRALLKSAKDKAELVMIVDLLRNDLGRVCKYGSVKVSSMRTLEAYSTVYQTTASIEGILHRGKDRIDLLKACFPGGSITGCPKIRSMQIIEELEPTSRSIYTGSLGYLSFHNTMDLNVLIRTVVKKDDTIYFQVGGGIVADSQAESEFEETLVKARGIIGAIEGAG